MTVGTTAPATGVGPYSDLAAPPAAAILERGSMAVRGLEFDVRAFYSPTELEDYRERRTREDRFRRNIAPPVDLRARQTGGGVLLQWSAHANNAEIEREVAANPLLRTGYRIYRWRSGEQPKVIATGALNQTSYLDREVGPRGGEVFYSVLTVLEGRVGTQDSVIESERSEAIQVQLTETFELRLVEGGPAGATFEVTVPSAAGTHTHRFEVAPGQQIGEVVTINGTAVDFATGLTVTKIQEVQETRDEVIHHPVFNPDGSRAFDETGFLYREEVRKVPIRRLEAHCSSPGGATRVLSLELP